MKESPVFKQTTCWTGWFISLSNENLGHLPVMFAYPELHSSSVSISGEASSLTLSHLPLANTIITQFLIVSEVDWAFGTLMSKKGINCFYCKG